jgi:predicted MFS family arabinose efflux permease
MLALGSLLGALGSARRSAPPRQQRLFLSALAFAVLELAVGLAPSFAVMAVLLVPTGVAILTFTTTANATVQLGSAPHMRGRVMGLYMLVFLGGTPIGAPIVGLLAQALGPRAALVLCGLTTGAAVVAAALWTLRARSLRLEPRVVGGRPTVRVRVMDAAGARR